jgi:hypothetical protein
MIYLFDAILLLLWAAYRFSFCGEVGGKKGKQGGIWNCSTSHKMERNMNMSNC